MHGGPNWWYWFVRNLVRYGFFVPSGGFRVSGLENVPRDGPLIVAPNHVSTLDPPVIACSINRRISFMAKEELFRSRLFGGLIRSLGSFPVRRGEADTEAIKLAIRLLGEGHAVLIFPEGTRGDGSTMLPVNRGVAMLAKRSGAPVLPVGIAGTHRKMPKGRGFPRFVGVRVRFGEPFRYEDVASHESERENREAFALELERRIVALCNAEGYSLTADESGSPKTSSASHDGASEPSTSASA
jgi:1-acyl-sn-glycerol-3-phosphate acyltransferase